MKKVYVVQFRSVDGPSDVWKTLRKYSSLQEAADKVGQCHYHDVIMNKSGSTIYRIVIK